jgi:hypothetical protein
MCDIEDDMDPIQAMLTHGAIMPDEGNDAFFAVANLGLVSKSIQKEWKQM